MFHINDRVIYSNTGNTYKVVAIEGDKLGVYRQSKIGDVGRYMMIDAAKCTRKEEE
jgi:hypothetical protein